MEAEEMMPDGIIDIPGPASGDISGDTREDAREESRENDPAPAPEEETSHEKRFPIGLQEMLGRST